MPRYGTINSDYLASWFQRDDPGGPMWALNLMQYREWAEYADGRETDLTGAQAIRVGPGKNRRDVKCFDGNRFTPGLPT